VLWFATIAFGAAILLGSLEPRWSWYVLTHYFYRNPEQFSNVLTSGILIAAVPAYATVGAIVASLRPKNGVGWLCLTLGLVAVLSSWQPTGGSLDDLAGVLSGLAWFLIAPPLAVTLMLLIYPDGRLPSHRWWLVVVMALVSPLLGLLTETLYAYPAPGLVQNVGLSVSFIALLASVVAIVLRWVRSRGRERQQIKLLVYAVTGTAVALIVALASSYILGDIPGAQSPLSVLASVVAFGAIALGIPVAIGVALLKYRLYDVDTVINRTLVYGLLTVLLVLVYFGA